MPRRKDKHPGPPPMRPEIKQKFQQLIGKGKEKKERSWISPKWQLWRWDTLQDAPQE